MGRPRELRSRRDGHLFTTTDTSPRALPNRGSGSCAYVTFGLPRTFGYLGLTVREYTMTRASLLWVAGFALIAGSAGCASVLGIEDGIPDDAKGPDSGGLADASHTDSPHTDGAEGVDQTGPDGSTPQPDVSVDGRPETDSSQPDLPDASITSSDATVDAFVPPPCQLGPETAKAIFAVTSGGSGDSTLCGSSDVPCNGINIAITRAKALGRTIVYANAGTYNESVQLAPGITIEGGWNVLGKEWSRDCGEHPEALAIISPTSQAKAVVATDLKGAATLRLLTIHSKLGTTDGSGHGESVYGLFASSSAAATPTTVNLEGVVIVANNGGSGTSPTTSPDSPPQTGGLRGRRWRGRCGELGRGHRRCGRFVFNCRIHAHRWSAGRQRPRRTQWDFAGRPNSRLRDVRRVRIGHDVHVQLQQQRGAGDRATRDSWLRGFGRPRRLPGTRRRERASGSLLGQPR